MFCEGWHAVLQPGAASQWAWGLPNGLRGAAQWPEGGRWLCVHREEKDVRGGQEPSDGKGRGSHVGLIEGWHPSDGLGSDQLGLECGLCVRVCVCARGTHQFSPTTVDRLRLLGPAREEITFWFSRLNAEVSVN